MTHPSLMTQWDVDIPTPDVPEKKYVGRRWPGEHRLAQGRPEVTVIEDGRERPLRSVGRHSPDGFEWGYGGSGPSELALSLLADHLGFEPEPWLYQQFKSEVVSRLRHDGWALGSADLAAWLSTHLTRGRP